jgi:hypothetical protein
MDNTAKQLPDINIVYIDPQMTGDQREASLNFLYESHVRRRITKPVSIKLAIDGGFTINEGDIVMMTPQEIAKRFNQKLAAGEEKAVRFNQLLCDMADSPA